MSNMTLIVRVKIMNNNKKKQDQETNKQTNKQKEEEKKNCTCGLERKKERCKHIYICK